ncbi:MAG: MAPEG family protein, partial [Pseudomonadota bacterium]
MLNEPLIAPMFVHLVWVVLLYTVLTIVRAPAIWGIGRLSDGSNPWASVESRVSANLSNQFEWPLFFYAICLLLIFRGNANDPLQQGLAWVFVAGRFVHSGVQ